MRQDIDVILPFHRNDSLLAQAIASLSRSDGVRLKLILVDDSIEQNFNPIKLRENFAKIDYVRTGGGLGYGAALKCGSNFLTSEVIGLLNSDDLIDSLRFKCQIKALENFDLSITGMQRISKRGRKQASLTGDLYSEKYDPMYLSLGSYGANSTWLARKDWWQSNAFFDDKECLDWRIGLKCFSKSKIHWNPMKLYYYRKHENQVTADRNIPRSRMDPVYWVWKDFTESLGSIGNSRPVFDLMATPWLRTSITDLPSVKIWAENFLAIAKEKDEGIFLNLHSLIRRRFLNIAFRAEKSYANRFSFAASGFPEITSISKDILSLIQI